MAGNDVDDCYCYWRCGAPVDFVRTPHRTTAHQNNNKVREKYDFGGCQQLLLTGVIEIPIIRMRANENGRTRRKKNKNITLHTLGAVLSCVFLRSSGGDVGRTGLAGASTTTAAVRARSRSMSRTRVQTISHVHTHTHC